VAEEKLDLLQLAASGTAESSTAPPEIVWRELVHANLRRELLNDVPDELLRNFFAPGLPRATYATEKATASYSSSVHPFIQETPHPFGDGHGQNSKFVPPQSASQKDGESVVRQTLRIPSSSHG
jgi:hypothetical protein